MVFGKYDLFKTLFKKKFIQKNHICFFSNNQFKPPWNIIFFGTDNFSLYSLKALLNEYRKSQLIGKLEVCTLIKKQKNLVHLFAENENLRLRKWPVQLLKDEFHAGLVVSFGHLIPHETIEKFPLGMINVHASLLPRWRGAAPIIYSLANADTTTGVSLMRIRPKKFDIGEIISQHSIDIPDDMCMPELHHKLGELGGTSLIECLKDLPKNLEKAKPQSKDNVTFAPKVDSTFCCVNWKTMSSLQIYNLGRAVKGFLPLTSTWNGETIKLFNIEKTEEEVFNEEFKEGYIIYDDCSDVLKVVCSDRKYVSIKKVQVFKKKIMSSSDFNNGFLKKVALQRRYFQ